MARIAIGDKEKKQLYLLGGLLGAIIIVVFILYRPGSSGSSTESETAGTPPAKSTKPSLPGVPGAPPAEEAGAPAGGGESGGTGGTGAAGSINAASLVAVSNFRTDPFEPVPLPPPLPTPPPPPPPPPPVTIEPPSVAIASPGESFGGSLPPFGISGPRTHFGGTPPSRILDGLAPPYIPRVASAPTAPRIVTPPGGGGGGGGGSIMRSPNKRLSGVIIGDSVRALLEISTGENGENGASTVTRIVQPGDEVDGIRILRIERTTEAGRPVTRMYIRENGVDSFVDLRPAPQQATGAGAGIPGGGRLPF